MLDFFEFPFNRNVIAEFFPVAKILYLDLAVDKKNGTNYFSDVSSLRFISTGCNSVIGSGYPPLALAQRAGTG